MGYALSSNCSTLPKKNHKFGRKISKPKRPDNTHPKDKQISNKLQKRAYQLKYAHAYSPEYQVSGPVRVRPLSFSDEHKPDYSLEEETN